MLAEKPENAAITIFSSNRNLMSAKGKMLFVIGYSADWGCFHAIMSSARLFPKPTPSATPPRGLRARRRLVISKVLALIIRSWWIWIFAASAGERRYVTHAGGVVLFSHFRRGAFRLPVFPKLWRLCPFYRRRIKPHFNDRLMLYYWGYLCFAAGRLCGKRFISSTDEKNIGHQMRRFLLVAASIRRCLTGLCFFYLDWMSLCAGRFF